MESHTTHPVLVALCDVLDSVTREEIRDWVVAIAGGVETGVPTSGVRLRRYLHDHVQRTVAAVGGANDATTGQAIVAYTILRGGNDPTPELGEELRQHVARKIGPTARPKTVILVPDRRR